MISTNTDCVMQPHSYLHIFNVGQNILLLTFYKFLPQFIKNINLPLYFTFINFVE